MYRIVNMLSQISIFDLLQEASKKFKACSLTSIQWFNECYIIGPKVALDKNTYVERNKKVRVALIWYLTFLCVFLNRKIRFIQQLYQSLCMLVVYGPKTLGFAFKLEPRNWWLVFPGIPIPIPVIKLVWLQNFLP